MRSAATHAVSDPGALLLLLLAGLWFLGWGLALVVDLRGLGRRLRALGAAGSPRLLGGVLAVLGAAATAAASWLLAG